jgi:hypothetical protein
MTTLERTARKHFLKTAWELRRLLAFDRLQGDWARLDFHRGQIAAFRRAAHFLRPINQ